MSYNDYQQRLYLPLWRRCLKIDGFIMLPHFRWTLVLFLFFFIFSTTGCQTLQMNKVRPEQTVHVSESEDTAEPETSAVLSDLFDSISSTVVVIMTLERTPVSMGNAETAVTPGLGSGVVINKKGLILTAAHVVNLADRVFVQFLDGDQIEADILSTVPAADVALLKLKKIPKNLVVAELGDSNDLRIGDQIAVVGAPYGLSHTLTVGYVSGRRKSREFVNQLIPLEFIQTDAAINQGNSGGPMFDLHGRVIGITSRILTRSGGFEGLGFGVSINTAKTLLLDSKGLWTGIEFYLIDGTLARAFNLPQDAGLLIQRVAYNSLGDRIGLRAGTIPVVIEQKEVVIGGDIILSINDRPISKNIDEVLKYRNAILDSIKLDEFRMKVFREGKIIDLRLNAKGRKSTEN
jgi:serine protease Do